jgi:hypothetical protein
MKKVIFTICLIFCFVTSNAQYKVNISASGIEIRSESTNEVLYSIKEISAISIKNLPDVEPINTNKIITVYSATLQYMLNYSTISHVSTDGINYLPPISITDFISKITSVSSGVKVSSTIIIENYTSIKSSKSPTDISIPSVFKQGFVQWTNVGTGTVTISSPQGGSIILNSSASSISYPPATGLQYSGLSIALSGGATIQWQFSY